MNFCLMGLKSIMGAPISLISEFTEYYATVSSFFLGALPARLEGFVNCARQLPVVHNLVTRVMLILRGRKMAPITLKEPNASDFLHPWLPVCLHGGLSQQ